MDYQQFLEKKKISFEPQGISIDISEINPTLFDFQKDCVKWALRKGRAALFCGCGTGKTPMQLEIAKHIHKKKYGDILILAPLAVSYQTVREGEKFNIKINLCRQQSDIKPGINITNYEMLHKFDPTKFIGVVIDESSILKSFDGKTRNYIINAFQSIPYRYACTATPAPNDHMELGNHSEFLGIMTYHEMLSMFFVHDGGNTSKWRLKGHAINDFWRWIASWAIMFQKPSDIGYLDNEFILPPLRYHQIIAKENKPKQGQLYAMQANTLHDQLQARRESINERIKKCAELINDSNESWIIWCHLNAENDLLVKEIDSSYDIKGDHNVGYKEKALIDFSNGNIKRLITKPKIAGFGMNWQHCHKMVFVGMNHSFEEFYQTIRRCWRFGQNNPVDVYIIISDAEGPVVANIKRKEIDFEKMLNGVIAATQEITKANIKTQENKQIEYKIAITKKEDWTIYLGDCCKVIQDIPDDIIHYSISSIPFASLYTYSNSPRDLGNSRNYDEFWEHFNFFIPNWLRITMPGRLVSIHCMNLPTSKCRDGYIGLRDFRGDIIRNFQKYGWIYHSEVCIWKDPVVAVTRTKALGLLHKQLKKDSAMCRQGIPDYLVTFRKPGDNPERIIHTNKDFPVSLWQQYASPIWVNIQEIGNDGFCKFENDINPSDTLQRTSAREEDDEKHICPLQLSVVDRAIELWSMPKDLIFDPFSGIGSTGYIAVKKGRKYLGIELKESYYLQSIKNLQRAEQSNRQLTLF